MRRLFLLLVFLPTVALAADADNGAPAAPPAQAQDAGAQSDQAAPAAPSPPAPPPVSVAGDSSDCRMACAQTYYFCRASDEEQNCSPAWSRCVATCASPNLDPGVSTAP